MPRLPFKKLKVLLIPALAVSLLLSACADKRNKSGGVVDGGGGGDVIYTSKEDVLKAVKESWALITGKDPGNPLLLAYWHLHPESQKDGNKERDLFELLSKILSGPAKIPNIANLKPEDNFSHLGVFDLSNINYLAEKKLNVVENDLCNGPGDHKFLASVTSLSRDGEICVSVSGLMKLPSGSIRTDLLALFAHEIAHLNGADETLARRFQAFFLRSASKLTRSDGDEAKAHFLKDLGILIGEGLLALELPLESEIRQEDLIQIADVGNSFTRHKIPNPYLGPQLYINRPLMFPAVAQAQENLSRKFWALARRLKEFKNKNGRLTRQHWQIIAPVANELLAFYNLFESYLYAEPPTSSRRDGLKESFQALHEHFEPEKAPPKVPDQDSSKNPTIPIPPPPPLPPDLSNSEEAERKYDEELKSLVPPLDDPSKWIRDEE